MANTQADFRQCLVNLDADGARSIWQRVNPHLPIPGNVMAALHMARTAAASIPLRLRAYSHKWLTERAMPSQLPDSLKPSAERLYPTVVAGVGISVNSKYEAVEVAVRGAMENAVHDCFANGDTDPALVKRMMEEARQKERKSLGLKLGLRA